MKRKVKPPPPPRSVRRAEWKARLARILGLALCMAGFAAIGFGWAGAAREACVDCQIPYLISGGAAGVALVVLGAGLLVMAQMRTESRRLSARLEHMTWTLAERFMGMPTVNGDPLHRSGDDSGTGGDHTSQMKGPVVVGAEPRTHQAGHVADDSPL